MKTENLSRKTSQRITELLEEITRCIEKCEELAIRAEELNFCSPSCSQSTESAMEKEKWKIEHLEEQLFRIMEQERVINDMS